MPVDITWDHDLPVLIVTYHGELSPKAYKALCTDRAKALRAGPDAVVVLADMREFDGFPDARAVDMLENVLAFDTVRGLVMVVAVKDYNRLRGLVIDDEARHHYVYVYDALEQARTTAQHLLR